MAGIAPESYLWTQVAYNTLLLVGIPGNLIIIKVYHVKSPRCSAHIFIIGLALADLFVSLLRPMTIFMNIPAYAHLQHSSQGFCLAPRILTVVSMYSSVFLTSAVAFDRYYCVCRPHERKMTPFRAKIMVALSLVLSILVSLPSLFSHGLMKTPYGSFCRRISGTLLTAIQKGFMISSFLIASALVVILYRKVFQAIKKQRLRLRTFVQPTQSVLPTEVVAEMRETTTITVSSRSQVQPITNSPPRRPREAFGDSATSSMPLSNCNSNIVTVSHGAPLETRNVKKTKHVTIQVTENNRSNNETEEQRAKREKTAAAFSVQGRTSKMLLLTTAVFIISWTPALFLSLIPENRVAQSSQRNPTVTLIIRGLTNIVLLNHAINPVIYGFVNKRFRNDCIKVIKNIKWPWRRY
ncbi:probable G-protein coupled receptor No18 [Amphiura filiformis]|uniref:probable G-protein coupled receptor No18 n=1 Tax=Amphiura filiformis TaxID=82378 RepID=UPI003B2275F4